MTAMPMRCSDPLRASRHLLLPPPCCPPCSQRGIRRSCLAWVRSAKYMSMTPFLVFLICVSNLVAVDASLYEQARELYKQGPGKGPEIVRLLREHTKANPKDIDAFSLLGITLFGIEKPAEALPAIDRAIELATEENVIRPGIMMLRARTLYELNRLWECKGVLDAYWAFWQDSPELKKLYEWYYPRVKDAQEQK